MRETSCRRRPSARGSSPSIAAKLDDGAVPIRILHVVGARPNFMKVAPVMHAMAGDARFEQFLVHTGQHYDAELSDVFLDELDLPEPYANLGVGSGTHAKQVADVMTRLDDVLVTLAPDWVLVPGDVNSTLAAALVAVKRGCGVAHLEAGLRSRDLTMPEEINRILVDRVATLLLTPSRDADDNLVAEGVDRSQIAFVGNAMIDTLVRLLPRAEAGWPALRGRFGVDRYVADPVAFAPIAAALTEISATIDVVFPMHPRTRERCGAAFADAPRVRIVEPLGYVDFLALEAHAAVVLTDSGGIQEETTFLGVPCLTLRRTTERPVTVTEGTNRLVEREQAAIVDAVRAALAAPRLPAAAPELWDGHTAERVVDALVRISRP
jgi:UDP-N-acetylglucosamine 2-epimerase (non-hydrolysing)